MRSIGLVLLILGVFTWAQDQPEPPPPRVMQIHMKDNIDTIFCGQIDPDNGISFSSDGLQMKVEILELDTNLKVITISDPVTGATTPVKGTRSYYTSFIDSITFPLYTPPPPK